MRVWLLIIHHSGGLHLVPIQCILLYITYCHKLCISIQVKSLLLENTNQNCKSPLCHKPSHSAVYARVLETYSFYLQMHQNRKIIVTV